MGNKAIKYKLADQNRLRYYLLNITYYIKAQTYTGRAIPTTLLPTKILIIS